MSNYFSKPDSLVDAVSGIYAKDAGGEILEEIERNAAYKMVKVKQPDGRVVMRKMRKEVDVERHAESVEADDELEVLDEKKKLDPVDPKELKGKHSEREDGDLDNDGDEDDSDEYLHKRRKAIKKTMDEEVQTDAAKHRELAAAHKEKMLDAKDEDHRDGMTAHRMAHDAHMAAAKAYDKAPDSHTATAAKIAGQKAHAASKKADTMFESVRIIKDPDAVLSDEEIAMIEAKLAEFDLDEARGRPRKDGSQGNEPEPDEHFHMQIRKVTDYNKPAAVKHKNGQTTMLHPDHAKKINNALTAMKPNDREKVVNHMHAHPNNLKQVIQHVSK